MTEPEPAARAMSDSSRSIPIRCASWACCYLAPAVRRFPLSASIAGHALLFGVSLLFAFGMYWNFKRFERWFWPFFMPMLPLVVVIKLSVFARMGILLRGWRYFGLRDCTSVVLAAWLGSVGYVVSTFAIEWGCPLVGSEGDSFMSWYLRDDSGALVREPGSVALIKDREGWPDALSSPDKYQGGYQFPQSVFILDWGLTIAAVCGVRILARFYREENRPVASGGPRKCLIIGAGDTGEALLREILRMSVERYRVVGFLDASRAGAGIRIHDVPVLGRPEETRAIAERHEVDEILIADPSIRQRDLRRLVEQCEGTGVRFQIIPAMEEVIAGRVTVSQVRDVDIRDLLGRDQVELDEVGLRAFLNQKRVLVTGAGGSIGSEVCRQVCSYGPARLIMVEQAENNLFEIDREIRAGWPDVATVCAIADICDAARVRGVFESYEPEVVFHAAAHKHVPMMELNVGEAIKNNIRGTKVVADAAKACGVERFVMISTDKAVNPTSVMGCTKRVAEMYIQQLRQGSPTQFMTVRFGNVLGSSGSVVPIFRKQIAEGGPVTVTHEAMTRYFMTIPEATQLVLQAGVMGTDGDIFVLDMGEPVKIMDLAREMITLSGLRPGEDIEIECTGVRPGEKLFEELSVSGEDMSPTRHEQIYIWRNRTEDWDRVRRDAEAIIEMADRASPDALRSRLADIVPEYTPQPEGDGAVPGAAGQSEHSGSSAPAVSSNEAGAG